MAQNTFTYEIRATGGISVGVGNEKITQIVRDGNVYRFYSGVTELFSSASRVTGLTLNAGTLTLVGDDALTFTTTAPTNVTLPTSGTLATTANVALKVNISDTTLMLGHYITRGDTLLMLDPYILDSDARKAINDSINDLITNAVVGFAAADSNTYGGATTRTFVESLLGSGSGLSAQRLPFIIGTTTGAPTTADSTVTHANIAGKHIDVYRDGAKQYQNFTATNTVEGFRVSEGTITVNPLWQSGEQVLVDIIQPVLWSYLSLEGEESSLLDSLRGYWKLDETSGTVVTDAVGIQNGTRTAGVTVGATGKLGYANTFNLSADVINISYNTNTVPKGADFSFTAWIKLDSLPSVVGHENYIFQQNVGASPWSAHWIHVDDADDKITVGSRNTSGTTYNVRSTAALEVGTWYHVVFVNPGDGADLILYINGADVSADAGTFSGTLYEGLSNTCIGNAYGGAGTQFEGTIDSPAIWGRVLTSGEVTTLYNSGNGKTYPFN